MEIIPKKERPIIFLGEMVKAILGNRKSQSRRVVSWVLREPGYNLNFSGLSAGHYFTDVPESGWVLRSRDGAGIWNDRTHPIKCPYGDPGDRLWVREAWRASMSDPDYIIYRADLSAYDQQEKGPWKSSMFMPRAASRILLEIVSVRVERVQDISEKDAQAEGAEQVKYQVGEVVQASRARTHYRYLWDEINGKKPGHSWEDNPWCWIIEFKRIESQP